MKKFINYFLLLAMVLVVSSACSNKCKDSSPEVPAFDVSNVITGSVFNVSDVVETGVSVVCKLNGTQVGAATTTATGYKFDNLVSAGTYELTFSKTNFTSTTVPVVIATSPTAGVLIERNVVLMPEGVKTEIATDANGSKAETTITVIANDQPVLTTETTVTVPVATKFTNADNAPVSSPTIVVTPINDIPTQAVNASSPIAVLQCTPSGLKFDKPMPISFASPVGTYKINGLKLYYYNTKTSTWEPQNNAVNFANGKYSTDINHFSSYKIAVAGSVTSSTKVQEPFTISSVDNLNGRNPISITTVDVTTNSGYIYTTTPAQAVTSAGLTSEQAAITDLVTNSVKSKNGGFEAKANFTPTASKYPMVVTINPGVRIDFSAYREYLVENVKFVFNDGTGDKVVTVVTKTAIGTFVTYRAYNRDHTGGSGSN